MQFLKKTGLKNKRYPDLHTLNHLSMGILGFDHKKNLIFINSYLKNQIGEDLLHTGMPLKTVIQTLKIHLNLLNSEELLDKIMGRTDRDPEELSIRFKLQGKFYRSRVCCDRVPQKRTKSTITLYSLRENREIPAASSIPGKFPELLTNPQTDEQYFFREHLQTILTHSGISGTQTALIFIAIDHYAPITDKLTKLQVIALNTIILERLNRALHKMGISCHHWEEGRYALTCLVIRSISDLKDRLKIIQSTFNSPFILQNHELTIYSSMGISLYPGRSDSAESLIRQADLALTIAGKREGHQYVIYSEELKEGQFRPFLINKNLAGILDRNELHLKYQPRIDKNGRMVSVETLLRWDHPEMGSIPPEEFIPLAEDSGEIITLGEWVLIQACRQARQWMDIGINLVVSVNISPIQLHQYNSHKKVEETLRRTGLPAERLELEVTETTLLRQMDKTIRSIRILHEKGVLISLDDFGTGYSSLSYLGSFPVDILKIDQSFVKDLQSNESHKSVIQAITSLAKSFRYKVIAEGVETEEQLKILKTIGCNEFQGFYFHRPLSAEEIENIYSLAVLS